MAQLVQPRCFSDTVVLGCGKSSRGNYILTTNVEINVQDIEIIPTIRLIVIGGDQVGKTALTVRYLTKRLATTESIHSDFYYRQCIHLEGRRPVEIEIIGISTKPGEMYSLPIHRLRESDAIIVMYSITDRLSFDSAKDVLDSLSYLEPPVLTPTLLFGNKTDLNHLRKISSYEGQHLAQCYNASFHEISVADSPSDTVSILTSVVKELWHSKSDYSNERTHKRWGSSASGYMQRSRSFRDVPLKEREYEDYANLLSPSPVSKPYILSPSSGCSDDPRTRKQSVFDVSRRVFNNLIGRNSLPPDLPSSSSSSNNSKQSSMSLKNVFKKRSV